MSSSGSLGSAESSYSYGSLYDEREEDLAAASTAAAAAAASQAAAAAAATAASQHGRGGGAGGGTSHESVSLMHREVRAMSAVLQREAVVLHKGRQT